MLEVDDILILLMVEVNTEVKMSLHLGRFIVPLPSTPGIGQGHLSGVNNLICQKKLLHFTSYLNYQRKIGNGSIRSVGLKMSDSGDSLI